MTDIRKWLDLYESYESSLSEDQFLPHEIAGPGAGFEATGMAEISHIEWVEDLEHEGQMVVYFKNYEHNNMWMDNMETEYHNMTVPPFIDVDGLWWEVYHHLIQMGYKDLRAQFGIYDGTFYDNSISISVSNKIIAQSKSLEMKKRFKKESVNEENMEDTFLDEDAFFVAAIPNEYQVANPMVYTEWLQRYNTGLQIRGPDGEGIAHLHATRSTIIDDMNQILKKMGANVQVTDVDYDDDSAMGLYKIKYVPPKNFRQRK